MKTKIILIAIVLFAGFSFANNAGAAKTCDSLGGECIPSTSCGNKTNPDATDCGEGVCCMPEAPPSNNSSTFPNPIGADNASDFLQNILKALRGVVAIISIIFIIIGGIMYILAGGSEKITDKAKATITGAVVGLAIVMAAPAFLKQILEILGGTDASGELNNALTIKEIAQNILRFLFSITGIIAIISMVIGGGMYLTAYGDEDRIDKGKEIIKYSLLGIIVAFSALVIIKQLAALIQGV